MSHLKIHLTYQCTAECDHCHLNATRTPSPAIDPVMARRVIRELHRLNGLQRAVLLGGEPGLVPDTVHALCRLCKELDIWSRVETNASWAVDDRTARSFLTPFAETGTQIMFSVDAFHEPFVPLENVARALRNAHQTGVECVLEVPYLDFDKRDNPTDVRTTELLDKLRLMLKDVPLPRMFEGPVFFKSRAAHTLAPLVAEGRGVPGDTCEAVPWWIDSSQSTLDLLGLDPDGNLSKECGIAIGNVYRQDVFTILSTFDATKHPILSILIEKGPLGLAEEAAQFGYALKSDYADKCHLCQEAREVLREKYADFLKPRHHYTP